MAHRHDEVSGSVGDGWKAGIASNTITHDPDDPHRLVGFGARDGYMKSVDEDIHAKVLALEDETGWRLV